MVPHEAKEEAANCGNEGYGGKESKSIWSGGRSLNCGSTSLKCAPGCVRQLKRWVTVWSVEQHLGQVRTSAQPRE